MLNYEECYATLDQAEVFSRIVERKKTLGARVVILAHHYQPQETFQFADFTGDSLKLSLQAAQQRQAKYIVFCGVHFMAEVARMVCAPDQRVILPALEAGCSMADMATVQQVRASWRHLEKLAPRKKIIPITYINSSAAIKAFCGEHDGAICTSGNAGAVLSWAMDRGDLILFLPDQHLGRNTGYSLGLGLDQMTVYDPGLSILAPRTRMILWPGCCNIHMIFTLDDINRVRIERPKARIIVHPECTFEIVQTADESGSTEYIIKRVDESPPGSMWAIGTEKAMVDRLTETHAGKKTIFSLSETDALCSTMKLCSANRLLWVLDHLAKDEVVNEITVDPAVAEASRVALDRMLELRHRDPQAVKK